MIFVSVIVPTYNPHPVRLRRTLEGLSAQTLPYNSWELIVVDNGSEPPVSPTAFPSTIAANARIVREPRLGLSSARACGIREAKGELLVLVDDDNVLASDYLEKVRSHFSANQEVGMIGGKSVPEFEREPEPWVLEFLPLLALRDLGPTPLISGPCVRAGSGRIEYPACAPIGAGMALRRNAAEAWLARSDASPLSDRKGRELSSGGDNDIVLCGFEAGWRAAYFPDMSLTHLIPSSRLEPDYLVRLNRGIQKSWMQVLTLHTANPWPPLTPLGARLRIAKAWFSHRPWTSQASRIRYAGARGHFEGRVPSAF